MAERVEQNALKCTYKDGIYTVATGGHPSRDRCKINEHFILLLSRLLWQF